MDDNSFDALFSGLTGKSEEKPQAEPKENEGKKQEVKEYKTEPKQESRFCTILRKDLQKKIRLIALKESLQIKDVVEAALQKAVESYERKHGKVEDDIRGNPKNLF